MPRICELDGITIRMDLEGHNPPHFHANYAENWMSVDIRDFRVIAGELPKAKERLLFKWANSHKEELLQGWEAAHSGEDVKRIPPTID